MKEFLTVISLLLSGVLGEAPAPYPASGWRPSGPAFELPQTVPAQNPQQYLPVDPRVPPTYNPDNDVSVQGLPTQEQLPIFQPSPVNGQQYVGSEFNSDINNLDVTFRQSQFQNQQKIAREFERQRQLDAAQSANSPNRVPKPQIPGQFVPRTTVRPATTPKPEVSTTQVTSTTDNSLNEGEILNDDSSDSSSDSFARQRVSVEVSKQNIQEYRPELFLGPLAQLRYQPQLVPFQQFGQLQSDQQQGFDGQAHFSALSSVLAQQQSLSNQQFLSQQALVQNPSYLGQEGTGFVVQNSEPLSPYQINSQLVQPQIQYQAQPVIVPQNVNQVQADQGNADDVENVQNQPQLTVQTFQPQTVQTQAVPSLQPQAVPQVYQPQVYQPQPQGYQPQPQGYQPQPQGYQPQVYQPQAYPPQVYQPQPQTYQPQLYQPQVQVYQPQDNQQAIQPQYLQQPQQTFANGQLIAYPQDLSQYYQALSQKQVQSSLQSGLEGQEPDNGIEMKEESDTTSRDESTSSTVATAFGTRTQPRVFSKYGAPAPVPTPEVYTTTESNVEEVTDDGSAFAEATAVARGERRKSAKLRTRRIRPVFTLDRSGHLVLEQSQ